MRFVEVDLSLVGMRICGHPVECEEAHDLSDDERVYIFTNDVLHLVVDAAGGFSAYNPSGAEDGEEIEPYLMGNLIDYCGQTH